jgi:signal peptidase II
VRGGRYIFLAGLSLALVAADQGTKWWAATALATRVVERSRPACHEDDGPFERRVRYYRDPSRDIHVIDGHFTLLYVENCAGAFGILRDQEESVRRPFFLAVTVAAVVFIVLLFRRLREDQKLLMVALPFVLGGAVGNLVDRIHLRYVIDFVDWYHGTYHWPTFNVADAAIVVGVGLILLDMFPLKRTESSPARTASPTEIEESRPEDDRTEDAPSAEGKG